MADALVSGSSEAIHVGSSPVVRTRKELRIGYNSEFFQLYPFLAVTDDIAGAMIYA